MPSEPLSVSVWLQQLQGWRPCGCRGTLAAVLQTVGRHGPPHDTGPPSPHRKTRRMWPSAPSTVSAGGPSAVAFPAWTTATTSGGCWSRSPREKPTNTACTSAARNGAAKPCSMRRPWLVVAGDDDGGRALEQLVSGEPTPAFVAQAVEEYQRLLASLPKRNLCLLAQWKMEGFHQPRDRRKAGLWRTQRGAEAPHHPRCLGGGWHVTRRVSESGRTAS